MKYLINVLSFLILAPFCFPIQNANAASPGELKTTGVYLNEISVGSGNAWGTLKSYSGNLALYPGFLRIGFNMNSVAGIEGARSQLQLALEPFINSIAEPTADVETGMSIGLRYLHKLSAPLYLFTEASFAPMFLSIKSTEQGAAGFNFLDQGGVGLQYKMTRKTALFTGYRFRHISHAGLSDRSNRGINSSAILFGLSWLY